MQVNCPSGEVLMINSKYYILGTYFSKKSGVLLVYSNPGNSTKKIPY